MNYFTYTSYDKYKLIDSSKKSLFRKSSLMRMILGVTSTTSICFLFSLAHARWRNFHFSYVKNWIKGSFCFSLLFYTGNELIFAASNFYNLYTNFWINYTILAFILSKVHYRYLIRNNRMKWYEAIKYSHKCFLYFLVINLVIDLFIKLNREIYLYQEKDLFDIVREKYKDPVTNTPNFDMTYGEFEELFMKSFHIFNSNEKNKLIRRNLKTNRRNDINKSVFSKFMVLKTVDLYELYKNNKV
jgi:hypothetical protein